MPCAIANSLRREAKQTAGGDRGAEGADHAGRVKAALLEAAFNDGAQTDRAFERGNVAQQQFGAADAELAGDT